MYKSQTALAPAGYPLIIPMQKATPPSPLMPKINFITGAKNLPAIFAKSVFIKKEDKTKYGKSEGMMFSEHSFKDSFAAGIVCFEHKESRSINKITIE